VADLKDSNVDFLGRLNESELAVERAACLAQVLPSAWPENAPLAALEAAMDGVPLIVSDRGGLPEILQLGLKGAVMESCSPTGLADAINKAQSSSSNNLSELQDSFGWSHHLGEIETVYMTVLAGKIW
jgi:glycosyltransferase involved in cell wall biosynthesis